MAGKMKAQVFYEKEKMQLEDVPVPQISDIEVLVKVKNCGFCGSDTAYYYGNSPVGTASGKGPIILGHEFTGEVVEVGAVARAAKLFKPGDRVVVNPVQHCNACYNCASGHTNLCTNLHVLGVTADGGFAEYCASRYTGLFTLPDSVSYAAGAVIEPFACAAYGVKKLAIEPGQFVVIFGPGAVGLLMVQLCKSVGAGKVALIGTRDYRLEVGKKWGADYLFNTKDTKSKYYVKDLKKAIADLTNGALADRAITPTSSNAAFEQAIDITGNAAILVHFGLPDADDVIHVPADSAHKLDKEIRFSWLAPMMWPTAIHAVSEGLVKVEPLITGTVPLANAGNAIRAWKEREGDPVKVQVTP
ncbi:MAG: alcohol dehydrogenase catalytic domain-containing protein [Spirochaetia bacterium]|jgi:L-iditol 2-dehydrogenase